MAAPEVEEQDGEEKSEADGKLNERLAALEARLQDTQEQLRREREAAPPPDEDPETEKETEVELEDLQIPDEADAKTVAAILDKRSAARMEQVVARMEGTIEKQRAQAENEQTKQRHEMEASQIRAFITRTPDFADYKDEIRALYGKPLSLPDLYEFVKGRKFGRRSGVDRFPLRSSRAGKPDVTRKFKTMQEAGQAALEEVLGEDLSEF